VSLRSALGDPGYRWMSRGFLFRSLLPRARKPPSLPSTAKGPPAGTLAPFAVSYGAWNAGAHSSVVERSPYKREVGGSNPPAPTRHHYRAANVRRGISAGRIFRLSGRMKKAEVRLMMMASGKCAQSSSAAGVFMEVD
jgi:hypothetical protein